MTAHLTIPIPSALESFQTMLNEEYISPHDRSIKLFQMCVRSSMKKIGYIVNFLGNKHKNPPFKRYEKKIKTHPKLGTHSSTELKIGDINSSNLTLSDDYSELSGARALIRSSRIEEHACVINRENSLFLNDRKLFKFDNALEILRNADRIEDLCTIDPERFKQKSSQGSVLDTKFNIIYKFKKVCESSGSSHLGDFAIMAIRDSINRDEIKNIIVPKRELWTKKNGNQISEIIIEEYIPDLENYNDAYYAYNLNPELFNEAVEDISKLSHAADVSPCILNQEDFDRIHNIKCKNVNFYNLFQSSQIHGAKINYRIPKAEVESIEGEDIKVMKNSIDISKMPLCDFRKLPVKFCKEDGVYKFVLTNIDICKAMNLDTATILMNMFPRHREIVSNTMDGSYDSPDDLLSPRLRNRIYDITFKTMTKESIINIYKMKKEIINSEKECQLEIIMDENKLIKRLVDDFTGVRPYVKHKKIKAAARAIKKYFSFSGQTSRRNAQCSTCSSSNEKQKNTKKEIDNDTSSLSTASSFKSIDSLSSLNNYYNDYDLREERRKNLKSINPDCMEKFVQKEEAPFEVDKGVEKAKFYIGKPRCGIRSKVKGMVNVDKNIPLIGDESSDDESSNED